MALNDSVTLGNSGLRVSRFCLGGMTFGDFIGRDRARRDRIVIATKFFGNLHNGDPTGGGAGRKTIAASCKRSLPGSRPMTSISSSYTPARR